ncbi:MAG TPA: exo-alpha-sialidase [bacterium]
MPKRVYLLVGTHKGGFLFTSALNRKKWQINGPFFKGTDVHHMAFDLRKQPTIWAAVNSSWWGPNIQSSKNFGQTWKETKSGVRFEEGAEKKVVRIWYLAPGRSNEPRVLYAGVDPGALFKSTDGGQNWSEVKSLSNHATRDKWFPGAGGLMVHSICLHPEDKNKMIVGISAAGAFATEDGGASWEARNKGVLADFMPDKYPAVGQCVHHMAAHPAEPELLYQQNHCGVYRSENAGRDWIDISEGLPSRFGFPLQIHPHDPDTIYVIPEVGPEFRCPADGKFAVFRSRNRGQSWKRLTKGLPTRNAYLNVLRHAMAGDTCDQSGVYFGTSTGQILFSRDEGDSWEVLANWFPPIYSLSCAVF